MLKNTSKIRKITVAASIASSFLLSGFAVKAAEKEPIKIGVMLPYSGVYAGLGEAATNGLKQAIEQKLLKLLSHFIHSQLTFKMFQLNRLQVSEIC